MTRLYNPCAETRGQWGFAEDVSDSKSSMCSYQVLSSRFFVGFLIRSLVFLAPPKGKGTCNFWT